MSRGSGAGPVNSLSSQLLTLWRWGLQRRLWGLGMMGTTRPQDQRASWDKGVRAHLPILSLADAHLILSLTEHCMDFLNHSRVNTVTPSENITSPVMEFWE